MHKNKFHFSSPSHSYSHAWLVKSSILFGFLEIGAMGSWQTTTRRVATPEQKAQIRDRFEKTMQVCCANYDVCKNNVLLPPSASTLEEVNAMRRCGDQFISCEYVASIQMFWDIDDIEGRYR